MHTWLATYEYASAPHAATAPTVAMVAVRAIAASTRTVLCRFDGDGAIGADEA